MDLIPKQDRLEQKAKHIAKLQRMENATIINIQLKKGETIAEHDSRKDVVIVVRRGSVIFNVEGTETVVEPGNMLYMKPYEKHSLLAVEDTDLLVFQIMP